jgi:hypothetical protein
MSSEIVTGIKVDVKRDLKICFGDYCQVAVIDGDKSLKPRTIGALAIVALCKKRQKSQGSSLTFFLLFLKT